MSLSKSYSSIFLKLIENQYNLPNELPCHHTLVFPQDLVTIFTYLFVELLRNPITSYLGL